MALFSGIGSYSVDFLISLIEITDHLKKIILAATFITVSHQSDANLLAGFEVCITGSPSLRLGSD